MKLQASSSYWQFAYIVKTNFWLRQIQFERLFQVLKTVVSAIQKDRFSYLKGSLQLFKRFVSAIQVEKGRFSYSEGLFQLSKGSFQLFKSVVSAIQKGRFSYPKASFQLFKRAVSTVKRVVSAIQKSRFSYSKESFQLSKTCCRNVVASCHKEWYLVTIWYVN